MRNEVEAYEENKSSLISALVTSEKKPSSINFGLFVFKMIGQLSSPGSQNGCYAPVFSGPVAKSMDAQTLRVLRVY